MLSDIGRLDSHEAQIVLGAAVIDDVIGTAILSAMHGLGRAGMFSWGATARTTLLAAGFLAAALLTGPALSVRLARVVETMRVRGVLIVSAVCFAFAMALLAHALGTALIVGAFTAGLLLARTDRRVDIDGALKPIADIFVPVFFVGVGARVDLGAFNPAVPGNWPMLGLAGLLIALAILGKVASGWAAWGPGLNRLGIGVGMIARGEVGLIFARVGLASGVIDSSLYTAIVGTVVVATFIAPPPLARVFRRPAAA